MDPVNAIADKSAPLLDQRSRPWKPTPLPRLQMSVTLLIQMCDVLAAQSVNPYINQVLPSGDKRWRETLIHVLACERTRNHRRGQAESGILCWAHCELDLLQPFTLY